MDGWIALLLLMVSNQHFFTALMTNSYHMGLNELPTKSKTIQLIKTTTFRPELVKVAAKCYGM